MKILYAIQGTGNGHLSRAFEIVPQLKKHATVDVLISGKQYDLKPPFDIKYHYNGMYFVFGKNGGIDMLETFNQLKSKQFLKEIKQLPVTAYDLVVSDFEPVSSWACNRHGIPCIGLSNQIATLHPLAPKPNNIASFGKMILKHYSPTTQDFGIYYNALDKNIFTPVIRNQLRQIKIENKEHVTVYLPSFEEEKIIKRLSAFPDILFEVFSKHTHKHFKTKNIKVAPLNNDMFLKSFATGNGLITNAGFGATTEALYLGKKLLVIPMKNQYEQQCNAAMLKRMGVTVLKNFKKKRLPEIDTWLNSNKIINVNYTDNAQIIAHTLLELDPHELSVPTFESKPYSFIQ
nr:glycosyl transferase [Bacteroidota bacterium]